MTEHIIKNIYRNKEIAIVEEKKTTGQIGTVMQVHFQYDK